MTVSFYVSVPVMLLLVVLQTAVLPFFPIFGLSPQLPFLFALGWGLTRSEEEGLIWAFVGGLFVDIFSIAPLGLMILAYLAGITAVLWITRALPDSRWFLPILLSMLATAVMVIVYIFLMNLIGPLNGLNALSALAPLVLLHAIGILPVYWLLSGIDQLLRPRRVQL